MASSLRNMAGLKELPFFSSHIYPFWPTGCLQAFC